MGVPILKQGYYLIATIQTALTDTDLQGLRDGLIAQIGRYRARGVIIDITALDVMDSVAVRQKGRELAAALGFRSTDLTLIATAISELARNIVLYARRGRIVVKGIERNGGRGIMVVARDDGPGIPNVAQALQSGFSTSGGLGLGLPGVRRLTDEFDIVSAVGRGTIVTVKKWLR